MRSLVDTPSVRGRTFVMPCGGVRDVFYVIEQISGANGKCGNIAQTR